MVSTDKPEKNKRFAEEHGGNKFVILSDPSKEAGKAYGVMMPMGFAKRWTFYIDKEGLIQKIDTKIKVGKAGADILANLESMGL